MQIQVSNKFQVMARLQKDRLQGKRSRDFSRLDPRLFFSRYLYNTIQYNVLYFERVDIHD